MITRLKLTLEQAEYTALLKAAVAELRNPADQARYILRLELSRLGLLASEEFTDMQPCEQQSFAESSNPHL